MVKIKYSKNLEKRFEHQGFNLLPDEILLMIFEFVGMLSTFSMKPVCRRFYRIISGEVKLPKWIHRYVVPKISPLAYQFETIRWMMEQKKGGILNLEAGMGKTFTSLTYQNISYSARNLVICNKALLSVWKKECKKFYGDRFQVLLAHKEGDGDIRNYTKDTIELYDVVVTTYECVKQFTNPENEVSQIFWTNVFCDEAHRLRNAPESIYPYIEELQKSKFWALTGSLVFNSIQDVRNIQRLIDPASIYSIDNIKMLRFSDVNITLPPLLVEQIDTPRTEIQEKMYKSFEDKAIDLIEQYKPAKNTYTEVFAIIHQLRQTSISPYLLRKNFKLKLKTENKHKSPRIETIADICQKEPGQSVVFCFYRDTLELVAINLKERGIRCKIIHSEDSLEWREELIDRFVRGKYKVLLSTYRLMSEGYNLTNATNVILASPHWSMQYLSQAFKRCYRLGQTKPVTVKMFVTKGSIEERMMQLCTQKQSIEDSLTKDCGPRTKLTMAEIKMLF